MVCQKKGEEVSTWVQKLKTNPRSWEHNLSHTRHLSSHTPLMFRNFTDKLREWLSLIQPGQACSCHHKLLCSHNARSLKLQTQLVKPRTVGTRLKVSLKMQNGRMFTKKCFCYDYNAWKRFILICFRNVLTAETTQQVEFTGVQTERPRLIRRNTWTKLEGDITTETTSSVDYKQYDTVQRTTKIRPRESSLVIGEENFEVKENNLLTFMIMTSPISL